MNDRRSFKRLEWISFALFVLIGITIILLSFNLLPLDLFKITLALLLALACLLFVFLRKAIASTLEKGELRFRSAEDKFTRIYQSDLIGILISTADGRIVDANQAFLNMVGYSEEDLRLGNLRWDKLTAPEFLEQSHQAIGQLNATGTYSPFEKQYIKKNGSRIWVMVGSSKLDKNEVGDAITYVIDITRKKIAEKRSGDLLEIMKSREEQFKSVFMNAPAFITIRRGPELRYEFVNKTVIDSSKRDDYIGKTPAELYPGAFNPKNDAIVWEVYRSGESKKGNRYKLQVQSDTGEKEIYLDYYVTPVFDQDGKIDGVASFGFDVTDLVLANQEMQVSKDRFILMADSLPHKIWMARADGKVTYMNEAWKEYGYGNDTDKFDWQAIIDPGQYPQIKEQWLRNINEGVEYMIELRLKRADGTTRWHQARAVPLRDNSGQLVMWLGTTTDIHDQKEQVQRLIASEDHFRTLADETPFMVWKADTEGNWIYVNKEWIEFTGLSFDESLGLGYQSAIKPESRAESMPLLNNLPFEKKFQLRKADGSYRWVISKANPYYGETKFMGFVGSIIDITDQENATQIIKDLSDKKDEFLSIASHELKTPITSIKAFIQLIEKSIDPQHKAATFAAKASSHLIRLERLISDLLDVSKINSGKNVFNETEFDFHEMLEESIKSIQHTAHHQIILEQSAKVTVTADRFRIEQVVYNFLTNAIKYSPEHDKVIVRSKVEGNDLVVSFQDFGIGIEKENLAMIFDRYYRVDNSYMRFQGLGLGLFISAEIIKKHHGNFWIESEPNKGSTFFFSLPLRQDGVQKP